MNKTKLLIIDDEENVRNAIRQLVTNYCSNAIVVGEADSVKTGVSAIQQLHPDIVLLDVDIKDGSGFDLLGQFPEPAFGVIFITGYEEYAVKAFRFSALDFLLKPIDPDLLQSAIQKGSEHLAKYRLAQRFDSFLHNVNQLSKGNKKIALKTADNIHVVNLQEILYCEADRSYTRFFLTDKSRIMVSNTLGDYEELFKDYGFLRVHQSYLVNTNHVKRYEKSEGGKIVLYNETALPVSTRRKDQLLKMLSNL